MIENVEQSHHRFFSEPALIKPLERLLHVVLSQTNTQNYTSLTADRYLLSEGRSGLTDIGLGHQHLTGLQQDLDAVLGVKGLVLLQTLHHVLQLLWGEGKAQVDPFVRRLHWDLDGIQLVQFLISDDVRVFLCSRRNQKGIYGKPVCLLTFREAWVSVIFFGEARLFVKTFGETCLSVNFWGSWVVY